MILYSKICDNLLYRINDLEKEITRRKNLSELEAKLFYDELASVREKIIACETQIETNITNSYAMYDILAKIRQAYLNALNLKIRLTKILSSSTESTSSTETTVNIRSTSKSTEQFEIQKNLELQIHKQSFLIKQIESLKIPEDITAVKVRVMNNYLSKIYDSFILNQIQIEADIEDDEAALEIQQEISKEVQQKVIDLQTKLKEIEESLTIVDNDDGSSESTKTDITTELDIRIKIRESLIKRINSLEPKQDVGPEKARVMYTHLDSIYQSFNSNQTEIEKMVSDTTLDDQLEISTQIQQKVIQFQATLEEIFAPIIPSSSTQPEEISSQEIKTSESENDISAKELEVLEDIQNNVTLLQTALQKFLDGEYRENKSFDKLSDIVTLMFQLLEKKYGIDIP